MGKGALAVATAGCNRPPALALATAPKLVPVGAAEQRATGVAAGVPATPLATIQLRH